MVRGDTFGGLARFGFWKKTWNGRRDFSIRGRFQICLAMRAGLVGTRQAVSRMNDPMRATTEVTMINEHRRRPAEDVSQRHRLVKKGEAR